MIFIISLIKLRLMAKLDWLSILIYIWVFCLYLIISKIIFTITWFFFKITYIFEETKDYTISYKSPIFGGPAYLYDYITAGIPMLFWGFLFFIISFFILVCFLLWITLKDIPILNQLVKGTPFSELQDIFDAILDSNLFPPLFRTYSRELTELIKKSIRKKQGKSENDLVEKFESKSKNILDNSFYNDIKNFYIKKDFYYINAYKYYKHNTDAKLCKQYKIITPDMSDNDIGSIMADNSSISQKINANDLILNKNNI